MVQCFLRMRILLVIGGVVVTLFTGLLVCGRLSAAKHRELIRPFITQRGLLYVATRCDDYREQYGAWPSSIEQLRAFKLDLPHVSIDAWNHDFVFVPYDEAVGYGRLISYGADGQLGGTSQADRDLEVRFPLKENAVWNDQMRKQVKWPKRRFLGLFPYLPENGNVSVSTNDTQNSPTSE